MDLTQILTLGAVLVSLAFAIPQYESTRSQSRNLEQQQLTERFSKAVEQLGNRDNLEVRLGGIYSLQRIARDSPDDQATVINVLATFVRETTKPRPKDSPVSTDVQAALDVLGQRNPLPTDPVIDLNSANLNSANLNGAHLANAYLPDVNLTDASLGYADLTNAYLPAADLTSAYLPNANLTSAFLIAADLTNARLPNANLNSADLMEADLPGADLRGVDLRTTILIGANITGVTGLPR